MAAELLYNIKPYQIKKLITQFEQGGSITLDSLLTAVEADIAQKLPYKCAECVGTSLIEGQTKECPTCSGYGKTELQESVTNVVKTVTKLSPKPIVNI